LQHLLVKEGDKVTNGQLLAIIQPQEWKADMAFYSSSEEQMAAQVAQAAASLKYEEAQTTNQIRQAEANLASAQAQVVQAQADLEIAALNLKREEGLYKQGVDSAQLYDQMRTAHDAAKARVDSFLKQTVAAEAAVSLAKANQDQVAVRRAALQATTHQLAAMGAQREKAKVRLDYTKILSPINGIVDVRAALEGEVVNPGQAVVTLINPDNLWVRADVEETYIDRIHLKDHMPIRLPSGRILDGTVFYRRFDADYATQRDVSRTKRDIKTFEIRLSCDNKDGSLAVGMTAYVTLHLGGTTSSGGTSSRESPIGTTNAASSPASPGGAGILPAPGAVAASN
jgi:multidrug efflux pump subunit AcrA (membrane-fusion protein)